MNLAVVAATALIPVAALAGLYYFQPVPDGIPPNEERVLRMLGVPIQILKAAGRAMSFFRPGSENLPQAVLEKTLKWILFMTQQYPDGMNITDTTLAGVPVRIYKPYKGAGQGNNKLAGLVYYHGGGWCLGNIGLLDEFCFTLSKRAGVIVVSVEYRLAPEHPFPDPFDDCYNVAAALLTKGEAHGIDPHRVLIGGDSAGGNLAASVTLQLKNHHPSPAGQVLIYPALQCLSFALPSMKHQGTALLDAKQMALFWSFYINGTDDLKDMFLAGLPAVYMKNTKYASYIGLDDATAENRESVDPPSGLHFPEKIRNALINPKVAPLMADDLSGLPRTLLIAARFDVLASEGMFFKERLQRAGVDVNHIMFQSFHAFLHRPDVTDEGSRATSEIVDFLKHFNGKN